MWRDLVEEMPDMVWTCTASGQCDHVNARWVQYTGRPYLEQLGHGWVDSVKEEDRPELERCWRVATERGEEFCLEMRVRKHDGTYHWFLSCGSPIRGATGEIVRWVGACMEIDRLKAAEETARRNEERLEFTLAAAKLGNWELDLRSQHLRRSPSYDQIFGYQEPVALAYDSFCAQVEPSHRALVEEVMRAARAGQPWNLEFPITRTDGAHRWVWSQGEAMTNDRGEPVALRGVMQDITERKLVEEQLQALAGTLEQRIAEMQAVFDSLQSPVFVFDAEGKLIRTNRAAAQLTGIQTVPLDASAVEAVLTQLRIRHPDGEPILRKDMPCYRALRGDSVAGANLELTTIDGRQVALLATAAPLRFNGRLVGAVTIWHDVTERERLLREVSDSAAMLERRVSERTAALTESNRELEGFTYSVAHDLRAPLRHVAGFARILQRKAAGKLDAQELAYLNNIGAAIEQMGQLTDDLLRLAWASRVALRTGPVCLRAIFDQARQVVEPEAHGREIRWQVHPLPKVNADATLVQQVFVNLLSNALKFTRYNPQPLIEVGYEAHAGWATVYVRDNGVGFDPRHAEKLFSVFERLHDPKQFEGTGIGLALVQRIIQRHGGTVSAESQPGGGATFRLTLPLAEATEAKQAA